jgi:hypothetical protein
MLQNLKIPFTYKMNNRTYIIQSRLGIYRCTDSLIQRKELNFVKSVKQRIMREKIYEEIPNTLPKDYRDKILYFKYNPKNMVEAYSEDVFEVDINQAYWDTAFKMGLLDQKLYDKGFTVAKKSRLAALGSLAKKTDIYEHDGNKMRYAGTEVTKETEYLWFMVCHELAKVMDKAAKAVGNKFIFYWVDGIFVVGSDAVRKCRKVFEDAGYGHKTELVKRLEFNRDEAYILVQNEAHGDDEIKERRYPMAKKKIKP